MKKDLQDVIDDYLLYRMPEEHSQAFEQKANDDSSIQEQLSFTKDVQQIVKRRNEILARMEEWRDDYDADHQIGEHI